MGNCLFGGLGPDVGSGGEEVIKVVTSNGGVMEFYAPLTVESITKEFPAQHGIFRSHDLFWKPLSEHEELLPGHSYYLLPLSTSSRHLHDDGYVQIAREGHIRSSSSSSMVAPYRMSFDSQSGRQGGMLKRSYTEAFLSKYSSNHVNNKKGFWKVKLVISPEQLLEILSQDGRTHELIESVRTVAKCGKATGGGGGVANSIEFSDQWSLSSSRNNCSSLSKNNDVLLDI